MGRLFSWISLCIVVALTGCEKAQLAGDSAAEEGIENAEKSPYPFFRKLTDSQGRTVEAEVLGRNATDVVFVRWSDKRRFNVPIHTLSPADQTFLSSLPTAAPREEDYFGLGRRVEEPEISGSKFTNRGYESILEGRIEDIEDEIDAIGDELRIIDGNTIRSRTLQSQRSRLRDELRELQQEIADGRKSL